MKSVTGLDLVCYGMGIQIEMVGTRDYVKQLTERLRVIRGKCGDFANE